MATVNFNLAWVRLLIEGGSYFRVAFINFGPMLGGVVHKNHITEHCLQTLQFDIIIIIITL